MVLLVAARERVRGVVRSIPRKTKAVAFPLFFIVVSSSEYEVNADDRRVSEDGSVVRRDL